MTSEHGYNPMFGTKKKQDILILYAYLNNGVEFFGLHKHGNPSLKKICPQNFRSCMQILLLKSKKIYGYNIWKLENSTVLAVLLVRNVPANLIYMINMRKFP